MAANQPNLPWLPGYVPPETDKGLADMVAAHTHPGDPQVAEQTATPKTIKEAVEGAAGDAASAALEAVLPDVKKRVGEQVEKEVAEAVTKTLGEPQLIDLKDLTKADARSRALRTLLGGLALSVVYGIINVAGDLAGINWFTKDGWLTVAGVVTTSVVLSVLSYVGRLLHEPPTFTAALHTSVPTIQAQPLPVPPQGG